MAFYAASRQTMTNLPLLIESEDLNKALGNQDLLIIDLCSEQSFNEGHIPGAIHVLPSALTCGQPPAPGKLPSLERLEHLFGQLGLTPNTHVVAYDDEGGGWAGRLIWTLDVIGHKNYSYLNGGIHAWRGLGFSESQDVKQTEPTQLNLTLHREHIADVEDIMEKLGQPNFAIWDARSPQEFRGERVFAAKGGHIPGAINCEWTSLMDPQRDLRLRTDALERLNALGLNSTQEIVTHCQTHHRSGFTFLVGKILGFNIKAFPGSWSEWGNHPDTPVEL
jgi:thiosulfate/3-mercaptopyruvate sulfurtransferase